MHLDSQKENVWSAKEFVIKVNFNTIEYLSEQFIQMISWIFKEQRYPDFAVVNKAIYSMILFSIEYLWELDFTHISQWFYA